MKYMTDNMIINFIERNPDFHVMLDNDMFILYKSEPPELDSYDTDEEHDVACNEWADSAISVDRNPKELLILLIEYCGGTSEGV